MEKNVCLKIYVYDALLHTKINLLVDNRGNVVDCQHTLLDIETKFIVIALSHTIGMVKGVVSSCLLFYCSIQMKSTGLKYIYNLSYFLAKNFSNSALITENRYYFTIHLSC